jgi:hypothetical protein
VNFTEPTGEVLPALSVARKVTVCAPAWLTDTGAE